MNICSHKAPVIVWAVILFFATNILPARSQGLVFSSFEEVQEKRTSLVLNGNNPLCLDDDFGISFNFNFFPDRNVYYGYLLRMINHHQQNIDLIYNHNTRRFNIILGENFANLDFQIDTNRLFHQWNTCTLQYSRHTLSLTVNGQPCGSRKIALQDLCFQILFGACQLHNFKTSDVPPMQLKEVALYQHNKLAAFWPLHESAGNVATDSIQGKTANVNNPIWGTRLHQQWQLLQVLTVKGNASYTFNPEEEEVFMVGADSTYRFLLRDKSLTADALSKPVYLSPGFQSIFNPADHTLYSIHIDQQVLAGYSPSSRQWDIPFDTADITQYWQTNKFISRNENALYILGGYGQLKYKNHIQRCTFAGRKWEEVAVQQSDYKPRYLAAIGATPRGDTAYILGGYGSDTGEQMLNPKYFYDLLLFDVKNKRITKLFSLAEPQEPFVFASSMVIDTTNDSYYALMFPNDRYKSRLQLIKGSLHNPAYQLAGDTIPYAFLDNRSVADLYYCPRSNQLLAITQLTNRDKSAEIKIYSLAFPPGQLVLSAPGNAAGFPVKWMLILLGVTGGVSLIVLYLYKDKVKTVPIAVPVIPVATPTSVPIVPPVAPVVSLAQSEEVPIEDWFIDHDNKAVLLLFGEFQVIDKDKNALTHFFSPLIREMFLLIVIHTAWSGKGISSEKLYEILWHDKSERDARNNRSVNMVKLKGILEKLGSGVIMREEGKWKLVYDPALLWIDLADFSKLVKSGPLDNSRLQALLKIVQEGPFLFRTEYSWLEDIKSEISSKALDVLLREINRLPVTTAPEVYIDIVNAIFVFDPIHEEALRIKCKTLIQLNRLSLARSVYEKFCKDYRHMYGEPFVPSFQEIIS
ncbi:kelch repeat-containing protein [Chitinophaga sp. 30R24]|uniref:kelch repeat-containing protein n=1 Tax=Chitinophaga sp. 30R24 TaxID=3248838 RepID=UPI003B9061B9